MFLYRRLKHGSAAIQLQFLVNSFSSIESKVDI